MTRKQKNRVGGAVLAIIIAVFAAVLWGKSYPLLQTAGTISRQQRNLIAYSLGLMLIVIVPVFFMIFAIAHRYRADKPKGKYTPDVDGNPLYETIWWGVPILLIGILSVMTWVSSHQLDPYRPIASTKRSVHVQVIALEWKWLFLYPESGAASVNELVIPTGRPVDFDITSDAPMNSFWVPALGGQVYAMSGMSTQLHLLADKPGTFRGSSANISGDHFADMTFKVKATSEDAYLAWLQQAAKQTPDLDWDSYGTLAKPNIVATPKQYQLADRTIFQRVIDSYMMPGNTQETTNTMDMTEDQMMMHHGSMQ